MRLFTSPSSPFDRKVRACAHALGLEQQIELIVVDPANQPDALLAANPLGRAPTLITDDGFAIFDSAVICEYLNGSTGTLPIIPAAGAARWLCLRLEALGDGLMEAAVALWVLQRSGADADDNALVQRHRKAIARTLAHLEANRPAQHVDIGTIAIACALGYLDLRFAAMEWRVRHPQLAAWLETFSAHSCIAGTIVAA